MNCLNRVAIQEYIDKELDVTQIRKIESHLHDCEVCSQLYEEANSDKTEINDFISQLDGVEDSTTVPDFSYHGRRKKSGYYRVTSYLPLKVAASIVFSIGLFFILRTNQSPPNLASEDADLLILELIGNTDPNKAWHNSEMAIVMVNEKGEVIQSFLSDDN